MLDHKNNTFQNTFLDICWCAFNEIESEITTNHDKWFKLKSENIFARLVQANLTTKTDIPDITDFV